MEIFQNRLHRFDMLDSRFMRPTPGYLALMPPLYIILVAAAHFVAVESTTSMPYATGDMCSAAAGEKITTAIAAVKHQLLLTMASRR